jgi:hypothetical protein
VPPLLRGFKMKFITDISEPQLVGIIESQQDVLDLKTSVCAWNKDMRDSGYNQYQYQVVVREKNAYIELI